MYRKQPSGKSPAIPNAITRIFLLIENFLHFSNTSFRFEGMQSRTRRVSPNQVYSKILTFRI